MNNYGQEIDYDLNTIYYGDFYSYLNTNIEQLTNLKNQYMKLLSELTICEELNDITFCNKLKQINSIGLIVVAYKYISNNQIEIIGSGTIIIEPKIIHGAKSVGHIEDIVVKSTYRGQKISHGILNKLKEFANKSNCYKIILDCDSSVSKVYESNGFDIKGIQMGIYL